MIFGSYKSEWSDRLARALALVDCERPIEVSHGEWVNCGDHPLQDVVCEPCSARRYAAKYPADAEGGRGNPER